MVTGYGLEGPDAAKPGFDVTAFWSRAGVAHMHAPKGTDPFILRTGVGDHTTSLATVAAILAAVYEREKTGVGRLVQTSLLATGVYTVGSDMAVQLAFGKLASNRPRSAPFDPVANFYKSRDGHWFVINPRGASKDWQLLSAACGRPDLPEDERFLTSRLRKDNSPTLVAEFDKAFGALDFDEIARRLDEVDLVWAPVQTPAQVAADPQVAAAGALIEVEDGQGATYRSPAAPARFPGADATVRPAAPSLGQHTREILAEVGYSTAEIEAMLAAGSAA